MVSPRLMVVLPDHEEYEELDGDGHRRWVTTRPATVGDVVAWLREQGAIDVAVLRAPLGAAFVLNKPPYHDAVPNLPTGDYIIMPIDALRVEGEEE